MLGNFHGYTTTTKKESGFRTLEFMGTSYDCCYCAYEFGKYIYICGCDGSDFLIPIDQPLHLLKGDSKIKQQRGLIAIVLLVFNNFFGST